MTLERRHLLSRQPSEKPLAPPDHPVLPYSRRAVILISQRAVAQQGPMGCGVACVAYLARRDYDIALREFFGPLRGDDRRAGYTQKAPVTALAQAGLRYSKRVLRGSTVPARLATIPPAAVIYVKRCDGDRPGHYVVRVAGGWMDPMDRGRDKKKSQDWVPCRNGQIRARWPSSWWPRSVVEPVVPGSGSRRTGR